MAAFAAALQPLQLACLPSDLHFSTTFLFIAILPPLLYPTSNKLFMGANLDRVHFFSG